MSTKRIPHCLDIFGPAGPKSDSVAGAAAQELRRAAPVGAAERSPIRRGAARSRGAGGIVERRGDGQPRKEGTRPHRCQVHGPNPPEAPGSHPPGREARHPGQRAAAAHKPAGAVLEMG